MSGARCQTARHGPFHPALHHPGHEPKTVGSASHSAFLHPDRQIYTIPQGTTNAGLARPVAFPLTKRLYLCPFASYSPPTLAAAVDFKSSCLIMAATTTPLTLEQLIQPQHVDDLHVPSWHECLQGLCAQVGVSPLDHVMQVHGCSYCLQPRAALLELPGDVVGVLIGGRHLQPGFDLLLLERDGGGWSRCL